MYDLLLKNGMIADGTGRPAFRGDVAVEGGKIAAIAERLPAEQAREVVDVDGLWVTPGFIDIHSHSDVSFIRDERCEAKLYQGVTSELTGQCGGSPYPCPAGHEARIADFGQTVKGSYAAASLQAFCDRVTRENLRLSVNMLPLVGHGTLRCGVLGYENRKATPEEMAEMRRLLAADMKTGAWGMSLGLGYTPGVSADEEELCLLGEEVAPYGGIITSHMRDQGAGSPKSLAEMCAIGRHSGVHVHVAHFKAVGEENFGRSPEFEKILHDAQKAGVNISADVYPYMASSSNITNSFPKWSLKGGLEHTCELLSGPERGKLMAELEQSFATPEDGRSLLVVSTFGAFPEADGKNLYEISRLWGISMAEAAARITVATRAEATCISFCMSEADVLHMLSQEDFSIGSDGSSLSFDPALNDGKPHPRNFGTFPRFLRLAREKGFCTPETAVRRITGLTADRIGLTDRGYLRVGMVADITVLDMANVTDRADYDDPFRKPEGIVHVLMDGRFALRDGQQTRARLGRILLKKQPDLLAIVNGRVLDGVGTDEACATVLVENGKIKAVGRDLAVPAGARVIDASGCWVTPGFVEAHTHLSVSGEPKTRNGISDVNEMNDPITPQVRAIDAFDPCNMAINWVRRGGFTTCCVLPGSANVIGGEGFVVKTADRATVDEMEIPGTRVMKMALGENPRGVYNSGKIKTRMGTAALLRETLFKAREYSDRLRKAGDDPTALPARDFRLEALVPVVRGEMRCRIHCHRSDDIATAMRICEEFGLNYALEHATEGFMLADRLAEKGIICTIGPLVSGPYKQEVWNRNLLTPTLLTAAGVTVCLTEDSSSLTKLLPMHIGLCIRAGLPYADALRAVTVNAAKLLGIEDRVGSFEVGKDADIAIWDGDPFCNYTSCLHTIVEGEVYTHSFEGRPMM